MKFSVLHKINFRTTKKLNSFLIQFVLINRTVIQHLQKKIDVFFTLKK